MTIKDGDIVQKEQFKTQFSNKDFPEKRAIVKKVAKKSMLKSFFTSTGFDLSSWAISAITGGSAFIPSQIVNEGLSMITDTNYIRKANQQLIGDIAKLYRLNEDELTRQLEREMEMNIRNVKARTDDTKKKVNTSRKIILGSVGLRTKLGLFGNFLPAIGSLVTSIIVYKSIENFGYRVIQAVDEMSDGKKNTPISKR
ncbi:hypothetical protein [Salipaludibacillus daqingensis]|uniref:hypothetical protein n=1 Tax=Salipaludibacillus daqingensis TaxID=3041001 RepID=UPI00247508F8|nr:hypothetical protein [Salipaludibacillus daqingensis]